MVTYSIKSFFNLELIPLLAYIIVTFDNREARNADSMLITFNFKSLGSSREEGMCLFLGALMAYYITCISSRPWRSAFSTPVLFTVPLFLFTSAEAI